MAHDVVVVGGGIVGLSVSFHLTEHGATPLVLERTHLGAGSTGKSGAIIRQHYSMELTARMARDCRETFENFDDYAGGPSGFRRCGAVVVVDGTDASKLRANVEMQKSVGIDTQVLDETQLGELVPTARFAEGLIGCYEPGAGYAEPLMTLKTLSEAVLRGGGEIREGVEVLGFELTDSRVAKVQTTLGTIEADAVVVATGPWTARLASSLNIGIGIQPSRVRSAMFERPAGVEGGPVLIDFPSATYAKHAGYTFVGSLSEEEGSVVDPDSYDEGVDGAFLRDVREKVASRFEFIRRAPSYGGFGALYAVTDDWHPMVGEFGPERLYVCAGFSGHGFKLAPAVGRVVAQELCGVEPEYDFSPLRPDRFERGEPVRLGYSYGIMG